LKDLKRDLAGVKEKTYQMAHRDFLEGHGEIKMEDSEEERARQNEIFEDLCDRVRQLEI